MSGETYSAFVCPSCDAVFDENFLVRILKEKWSVIAGPNLTAREAKPSRNKPVVAPKPATPKTEEPQQSRRSLDEVRTPEEVQASKRELADWLEGHNRQAPISLEERRRRAEETAHRAAEKAAFAPTTSTKSTVHSTSAEHAGFIGDMREGKHRGGACRRP